MCITRSTPQNAQRAFACKRWQAHNLGMNMARIRKSQGLTQADLADMIGVDQSTIQRAEKGHSSAKLETYSRCADKLGVTLADLFSDDRTPVEITLLKGFRDMDEDARAKVFAILDLVSGKAAQPSQ